MNTSPNFDRVARIYRWAEYLALGPLLQRARTQFLPRLSTAKHALILGDGDGRFTTRLLQTNPDVRVHAVDLSAKMLSLLRKRCSSYAGRLTTLRDDALHIEVPSTVDLVVTHFFLDCLTQSEVDVLAVLIGAHTKPGTRWLVSDFAIPANRFAIPARIYIRALYFAFRLLTGLRVQQLPDLHASIARAGFVRTDRFTWLGGLLYTELWQRD